VNLLSVYQAVKTRLSPAERAFLQIWPAVNSIEGLLISPDQERWLFNTARELPDGANIVEIGSFKGRSTTCMAFGIKGTSKHIFAIDTFEGNDKDFGRHTSYYDVFLANLKKNGLASYVTALRGLSGDAARTWNKPIDFLFIDGGHEYEDVLADFQLFFPYVVPGGLIGFHDVHNFKSDRGAVGFPGVLKVWEEVASPLLTDRGTCATLAYGRKRTT